MAILWPAKMNDPYGRLRGLPRERRKVSATANMGELPHVSHAASILAAAPGPWDCRFHSIGASFIAGANGGKQSAEGKEDIQGVAAVVTAAHGLGEARPASSPPRREGRMFTATRTRAAGWQARSAACFAKAADQ